MWNLRLARPTMTMLHMDLHGLRLAPPKLSRKACQLEYITNQPYRLKLVDCFVVDWVVHKISKTVNYDIRSQWVGGWTRDKRRSRRTWQIEAWVCKSGASSVLRPQRLPVNENGVFACRPCRSRVSIYRKRMLRCHLVCCHFIILPSLSLRGELIVIHCPFTSLGSSSHSPDLALLGIIINHWLPNSFMSVFKVDKVSITSVVMGQATPAHHVLQPTLKNKAMSEVSFRTYFMLLTGSRYPGLHPTIIMHL